jgi:SAM-dependent methyltransferase
MTYTEHGVKETVDRLLAEHGLADPITPEQLNLLDQYHIGGLDAVDSVTAAMALAPDDRVLDIGSGFGGPARRIAQKHGATVHGIDITRGYVNTATHLTQRCGLAHLVTFECAGIEDHHPARPYTAALSMHVQMNIADKARWYRAIADQLAEGSQFAIWDVCSANSNAPIRCRGRSTAPIATSCSLTNSEPRSLAGASTVSTGSTSPTGSVPGSRRPSGLGYQPDRAYP